MYLRKIIQDAYFTLNINEVPSTYFFVLVLCLYVQTLPGGGGVRLLFSVRVKNRESFLGREEGNFPRIEHMYL